MASKPSTPNLEGARAVISEIQMETTKNNRYTHPLTVKTPAGETTLQTLPVPLPVSGETVYLRRGKGRDRVAAGNFIRNPKNPFEFTQAMLAQVALKADGSPFRFEEMSDMDEDDLDALTLARMEEDEIPTQAPRA